MKRAHAVIGANYGDEGKGLMTDYLCSELGAGVVVRFNGGAQAGHTVVTPEGARHVFHHLGSGSFLNVPTFLSKYFITNPILFWQEKFHSHYKVFVSPESLVTLPFDMLINQAVARINNHGSCGVGINETVTRCLNPKYRTTVSNMLDRDHYRKIQKEYYQQRCSALKVAIDEAVISEDRWEAIYFDMAEMFLNSVTIAETPSANTVLFEGAQGLMLDQASPDFPHVSRSNTGIKNVKQLCAEWKITDLAATYVTRSYLTRHGNGPLPNEEPMPSWVKDNTNIDHEFQGSLRYAPLDILTLERRIIKDAGGTKLDVAITHADQYDNGIAKRFNLPVCYKAFGPMRTNVHDAYLV